MSEVKIGKGEGSDSDFERESLCDEENRFIRRIDEDEDDAVSKQSSFDEENRFIRRIDEDEDDAVSKTVVIGALTKVHLTEETLVAILKDPKISADMMFLPLEDDCNSIKGYAYIDFPSIEDAIYAKGKFDGYCITIKSGLVNSIELTYHLTTTYSPIKTAAGEREASFNRTRAKIGNQTLTVLEKKHLDYYLAYSDKKIQEEVAKELEEAAARKTMSSYTKAVANILPTMSHTDVVKTVVRLFGNPICQNWTSRLDLASVTSKRDALLCIPEQKGIEKSPRNGLSVSISAAEVYWAMVVLCSQSLHDRCDEDIRIQLQQKFELALRARKTLMESIVSAPDIVEMDACDCRVRRFIAINYFAATGAPTFFPGAELLCQLKWRADPEIVSLVLPHPRELDLTNGCPSGPSPATHAIDIKKFMISHWPHYDTLHLCRKALVDFRAGTNRVPSSIPTKLIRTPSALGYKVVEKLSWNPELPVHRRSVAVCTERELQDMLWRLKNAAEMDRIAAYYPELIGGNNNSGLPVIRFIDNKGEPVIGIKVKNSERIVIGTSIFIPTARSALPTVFPFSLYISRDAFRLQVPELDEMANLKSPADWLPEPVSGISNPICMMYFDVKNFSPADSIRELFDSGDWAFNAFRRCLTPNEEREIQRDLKQRKRERQIRDFEESRKHRKRERSPERGWGGGVRGLGFHSTSGGQYGRGRGLGFHSTSGGQDGRGRGLDFHSTSGGQDGRSSCH